MVRDWRAADAGLAAVAAAMGFPPTQKRELTVYFATDIFGKIGLPPTASAMCSLVPGGIGLALRVDTKRLTGVFEATGSTVDDFYRGLDTFTGLPSDPALRNQKIELTVGDHAAYQLVPSAHLASLYGARAWDAWLTAHHGGPAHTAAGGATGASIVSSALAAEETTWLLAWSQRNVPRAANGAERTALTRDLLVAARAIESSPYRTEILAVLRAGVGTDAALDAAHLEAVTHQVGFDAERREADADRADAERAAITTTVDPIIDAKLPAALKVNAGLVVDGDVVPFVIDIDWTTLPPDQTKFADRAWSVRILWSFSSGTTHRSVVTTSEHHGERLTVLPGEHSTVWLVTAFVETSHYWPTRVGPVEVEVKPAAQRVRELESDALGGAAALDGMTRVVDAPGRDGVVATAVELAARPGPRPEVRVFSGPMPFVARSASERSAARDQELEQLESTLAYFESHPGKFADAIAVIHDSIRALRQEQAALASVQRVYASFDVRATFLSREAGVPSGPLDLLGTCEFDPDHRGAGGECRVALRDRSRRGNSDVVTVRERGETFETALRACFEVLGQDYADGTLAIFAEGLDAEGPTGRVVGFEMSTLSASKDLRKLVRGQAFAIATAFVDVLAMMFPPMAPIAIALTVANTASTIDQLRAQHETGTLTTTRAVIGIGTIGLSLVGGIRSSRLLGEGTFALKLGGAAGVAGHALGVLVFGASIKEHIEQLDANDVSVLAQMYAELVELEQHTHASDPKLASRRAEIRARAEAAGRNTCAAIGAAVEDNAIMLAQLGVSAAIEHATAPEPGDDSRSGRAPLPEADRVPSIQGAEPGGPEPTHARSQHPSEAPARGATSESTESGTRIAPAQSSEPTPAAVKPYLDVLEQLAVSDPRRVPGAVDRTGSVEHLGLQLAATVGGATYRGAGVFALETARGVIDVEVHRTSGAARVVRHHDQWIAEIPKGLVGTAFERSIVGTLTEARGIAAAMARGETTAHQQRSGLGPHATAERLSPADMGAVAELRVLRTAHADLVARGPASAELAMAAERDVVTLETRLGLLGDAPGAERRRQLVDAEVVGQSDAGRRGRVAVELEGESGHAGSDLHTHFSGIVGAEVFRQRAAMAASGSDSGSWVPLLKRIAGLPEAEFAHQVEPGGRISRRAKAGNAHAIAVESLDQVTTLDGRASTLAGNERAAVVRARELLAREACETALAATPETDFDSAYEVRDQLVKDTFAPGARDRTRQDAYDDYIREAILELARDGLRYVEPSASLKKVGGVFEPARIAAVYEQMVAEGLVAPGQVEIQMLAMMLTGHFGHRDAGLPAVESPREGTFDADVGETVRLVREARVVGSDTGGPESSIWSKPERVRALVRALLGEARRTGKASVYRPHLGEGSVDPIDGESFHTDKQRHLALDGKPTGYARAHDNIEVLLGVLEELDRSGELDRNLLLVRIGHATHADAAQAARMQALGVIAEVNLRSNIATGAISQTEGPHGPRSPVEQLDDHSFVTLLYYDVPIAISTDAGAVMGTTLRAEYQRARQLIEDVLAGQRGVRVSAADARIGKTERYRGTPVAGNPREYELRFVDLSPAERQRFLHGYEKLYADAEAYTARRPGTGSTPGRASAPGLAHHTDVAVQSGLISTRGRGTYEGAVIDVARAAAGYRSAGYLVVDTEGAGGKLLVTVASADGAFTTVLSSWDGTGPAYLPLAPRGPHDAPVTAAEAHAWYEAQLPRIHELNAGWEAAGVALEERARRCFEVRKHARLAARELMGSGDRVARELRDLDAHGDIDGASFEALVERYRQGRTLDEAYEAIIGSARRSSAGYDHRATRSQR